MKRRGVFGSSKWRHVWGVRILRGGFIHPFKPDESSSELISQMKIQRYPENERTSPPTKGPFQQEMNHLHPTVGIFRGTGDIRYCSGEFFRWPLQHGSAEFLDSSKRRFFLGFHHVQLNHSSIFGGSWSLNQPLRGSVFVGMENTIVVARVVLQTSCFFFLMASLVGVGPFSTKVGGNLFQLAWSSATPTKIWKKHDAEKGVEKLFCFWEHLPSKQKWYKSLFGKVQAVWKIIPLLPFNKKSEKLWS